MQPKSKYSIKKRRAMAYRWGYLHGSRKHQTVSVLVIFVAFGVGAIVSALLR
jgi:hypothetical protein